MYKYTTNKNMNELINYSTTILEPKIYQKDSMESICPALQPVQMTVNLRQTEEKENSDQNPYDKQTIYYICFKCKGSCQIKDIFAYQEDINISYFKPICMTCSKEVEDIKRLRDWIDVDVRESKRVCLRCKNSKPQSRFAENNKYCNLCLVKKKWSRLKNKYESNYEMQRKNTSSELVKCCKCLKMCKKFQTFAYIESEYQTKQFICLKCSLDVSDWYELRDWEDKKNPLKTKMCSRCKKNKSIARFSRGKSGCEYCSLKRKRSYLLQKRKKEEEDLGVVDSV